MATTSTRPTFAWDDPRPFQWELGYLHRAALRLPGKLRTVAFSAARVPGRHAG